MSKTMPNSHISTSPPAQSSPLVLNVGGFSKEIPLPTRYAGYEHVLLDISNLHGETNIVMDARKLILWANALPKFDAVYCSHNLEHYYLEDASLVMQGMFAVLKPGGSIELRVPDIQLVCEKLAAGASLYDETESGSGVVWHDCIYGNTLERMRQGEEWAHKTGFTETTLRTLLEGTGFVECQFAQGKGYELAALAFKPL